MKLSMMVVAAAMMVVGTGCGASTVGAVQPSQTATAGHWETKKLADGVEIRVSDDAGPEATRIVEDFQKEMRARYINAQ
jgi:hypothetical protein